jgi:hypothetical protein
MRAKMTPFIYRCPVTGRNVQGFFAAEVKETETYEPVTCALCTRVHQSLNRQNARSGKRKKGDSPIKQVAFVWTDRGGGKLAAFVCWHQRLSREVF